MALNRYEIRAVAIVSSRVLDDRPTFLSFLKASNGNGSGVIVGGDDYHKLKRAVEKQLGRALKGREAKRFNMVCEGKRHETIRACRAAKHTSNAAARFHKSERVDRKDAIAGGIAAQSDKQPRRRAKGWKVESVRITA